MNSGCRKGNSMSRYLAKIRISGTIKHKTFWHFPFECLKVERQQNVLFSRYFIMWVRQFLLSFHKDRFVQLASLAESSFCFSKLKNIRIKLSYIVRTYASTRVFLQYMNASIQRSYFNLGI